MSVNLSAEEARCLATRLAARYLAEPWLEWEDVPMLGEFAFERLNDAVESVASDLFAKSKQIDRMYDVDSAELLERTQ